MLSDFSVFPLAIAPVAYLLARRRRLAIAVLLAGAAWWAPLAIAAFVAALPWASPRIRLAEGIRHLFGQACERARVQR